MALLLKILPVVSRDADNNWVVTATARDSQGNVVATFNQTYPATMAPSDVMEECQRWGRDVMRGAITAADVLSLSGQECTVLAASATWLLYQT